MQKKRQSSEGAQESIKDEVNNNNNSEQQQLPHSSSLNVIIFLNVWRNKVSGLQRDLLANRRRCHSDGVIQKIVPKAADANDEVDDDMVAANIITATASALGVNDANNMDENNYLNVAARPRRSSCSPTSENSITSISAYFQGYRQQKIRPPCSIEMMCSRLYRSEDEFCNSSCRSLQKFQKKMCWNPSCVRINYQVVKANIDLKELLFSDLSHIRKLYSQNINNQLQTGKNCSFCKAWKCCCVI